jgi:hypothetical protein
MKRRKTKRKIGLLVISVLLGWLSVSGNCSWNGDSCEGRVDFQGQALSGD